MKSIAAYIRSLAEDIDIKAVYKNLVEDYSDRAKAFGINRDGDLFQVVCPVCGTKKVFQAFGGIFVCSRKHVFHVNTEDGVQEITPENEKRVLGDDLKDGRDAHDHSPYTVFKPKERAPIYLLYWFDEQDSSLPSISDIAWRLREKCPIADSLNFDFMTEIETMRGGEPIAVLGSFIKTWPIFVNNMKWFIMMNKLAQEEEWRIGFLIDESI